MTVTTRAILAAGATASVWALSAFVSAQQPPPARAGGVYALQPTEYGMELRTPDGRPVLEYLTKKPATSGLTSASAACFHPSHADRRNRHRARSRRSSAPSRHLLRLARFRVQDAGQPRQLRSAQAAPRAEHHEGRFLGLGRVCDARRPRGRESRGEARPKRRPPGGARDSQQLERGHAHDGRRGQPRERRERDGVFVLDLDTASPRRPTTC